MYNAEKEKFSASNLKRLGLLKLNTLAFSGGESGQAACDPATRLAG